MTGLVLSFIGAVIAMSIGLVPIVAGQRQKGRTNFREWRRAAQIGAALVISGAIVAMLAVVGSARSEQARRMELQAQNEDLRAAVERLEDRIESLILAIAEVAMETPPGQESPPPDPTVTAISILEPTDGSTVGFREVIRGKTSDPGGRVLVIVHPMNTSSYWVQAAPTVAQDGEWNSQVYFGTESIGVGEYFMVLAILDPPPGIREGQVLDAWPEARLVSIPIAVRRR